MRILAIERPVPGVSPEQFTPDLATAEARRVWDLYQQGAIRVMFFRADEPAALLVLESADVAEARTVLATLPLALTGLIDFEVIPLRAYPGFARLFEQPT
jgi:muconolactone delta-isomerase